MTDLRIVERQSIEAFVQRACDMGYVTGRVLDYGCGKQPYREIIEEAGAFYEGYDSPENPASVVDEPIDVDLLFDAPAWDTILCTQVIQYVPCVPDFVADLRSYIHHDGYLVMTYPTHWPEVEPEDLWRITRAGMDRLLTDAGFTIFHHERRAELVSRGENLALGYGVIARA